MTNNLNSSCELIDGLITITSHKRLLPNVLKKIEHEIAKDLTKLKVSEIEQYVTPPYT